MEVLSDRLSIDLSDRDEKGRQLAPEEKPAAHELLVDIPLRLGGRAIGGLNHGGAIQKVGTVAEFAHDVQHNCWACKWFNNEAWLKLKAAMEASHDPKSFAALGQIRAQFLDAFSSLTADSPEVEAAMRDLGKCEALSAVFKDDYLTTLDGGCPTHAGPKGEDLTLLFEPRGGDAGKAAVSLYDALLRTAEGKQR